MDSDIVSPHPDGRISGRQGYESTLQWQRERLAPSHSQSTSIRAKIPHHQCVGFLSANPLITPALFTGTLCNNFWLPAVFTQNVCSLLAFILFNLNDLKSPSGLVQPFPLNPSSDHVQHASAAGTLMLKCRLSGAFPVRSFRDASSAAERRHPAAIHFIAEATGLHAALPGWDDKTTRASVHVEVAQLYRNLD
jgi:hypothetical protein